MLNYLLDNGVKMPALIMGTTGFYDYNTLDSSIRYALSCGCFGFDTSMFYMTGKKKTELQLGRIFKAIGENKNKEIFLTTKLTIPQIIRGQIEKDVDKSIKRLGLDQISCLLIHWPYENYYIPAYKKMVKLYKEGLVKSIGVSNFKERHINKLIDSGVEYKPMVNQIEIHPLNTFFELAEFCKEQSIVIQSYSPLGKMLPSIKNSTELIAISEKYHKSISQVVLRWHLQNGYAPIFRSKTKERIFENVDVFNFVLDNKDMNTISSMNSDYKICTESTRCPGY